MTAQEFCRVAEVIASQVQLEEVLSLYLDRETPRLFTFPLGDGNVMMTREETRYVAAQLLARERRITSRLVDRLMPLIQERRTQPDEQETDSDVSELRAGGGEDDAGGADVHSLRSGG